MFLNLLTERHGTADIRLDRWHVRGRRIGWLADEPLQDPHATFDRRCVRAVGRCLENTRVSQHAAAMVFRPQRHFSKIHPIDFGNSVVPGQSFVQKGPVGMDQLRDAAIVSQHLREEEFRLRHQRHAERCVVLRIGVVRLHRQRLVDLQPLPDKVLHEPLRLRILEHALNLSAQYFRPMQLAACSDFQQRVVWQRLPEKIRQPRRERVIIQRPRLRQQHEEVWRAERSLRCAADCFGKLDAAIKSLVRESDERLLQLATDRPTKHFWQELANQTLGVHSWLC